ncbi:hypothetical protein KDN24_19775 [Bacillus sp. Bva_UNVM-123]|uniref:hypothetical protein n=1 Tax=Bacillus sp. Bva_UNVM-123 TaxID=2829798 RepID=UPI00391F40D2
MKPEDLIDQINNFVEQLDFITARKLMEDNLEILKKHRVSLKSNARELLKLIVERTESGQDPITRQDMAILIAINSYASKFDMRSLKMLVKDKAKLLLRKDAVDYLNQDARVLLEGMGAIGR